MSNLNIFKELDNILLEEIESNKKVKSKKLLKESKNSTQSSNLKESIKYKVYTIIGEDGVYHSNLYDTVDDEDQAVDMVSELRAQGLNASYEKLEESVTEDKWNATEIDREGFIALLRDNEDSTHYYITVDANIAENHSFDTDKEAIDYFRNVWLKRNESAQHNKETDDLTENKKSKSLKFITEDSSDNTSKIEELKSAIKSKVQAYINSQKENNGDNAKSSRLEDEISSLNNELKNLMSKEDYDEYIKQSMNESDTINEDEIIQVNATNDEPDYVITDVTELEDNTSR